MKLIVESGSTKTDWVLISENKEHFFKGYGINPYFDNESSILSKIPDFKGISIDKIEWVYFFGPGLLNTEKQKHVTEVFRKVFLNAKIIAKSDIYATAIAGLDKGNGIAAILGTGAASAMFKDYKIVSTASSLGYLLGDEGSGASIGKRLIKSYLENELPKNIIKLFDTKYALTKYDILNKVYKQKFPNRFLASFVPFVYEYKDNNYIREFVIDEFRLFFKKSICKYPEYKEHELVISGSIAYFFSNELYSTAKEYDVFIKTILRYPIEGLIKYYKNGK